MKFLWDAFSNLSPNDKRALTILVGFPAVMAMPFVPPAPEVCDSSGLQGPRRQELEDKSGAMAAPPKEATHLGIRIPEPFPPQKPQQRPETLYSSLDQAVPTCHALLKSDTTLLTWGW